MASKAADAFVRAWVDRKQLGPSDYPAAPTTVAEMYDVHEAVQQHPLVASELGGLGGYKLGAVGAEGEPCLYAPLFGNYLVEAPGDALSAAAIHLAALEPEVGFVMGADLPPNADGSPHSVAATWAAVDRVVLCLEVCGKRGTPEALAASSKLGGFADTLSSGGVVIGPRLPASELSVEAVRAITTELFVDGTLVATGAASKVPEGGPAESLAFLANHLNSRGLRLKRGELVATGQTCNTKECAVGSAVRATFSGLGEVQMVIAP